MKRKLLIFIIGIFLLIGTLSMANSDSNVCCERTEDGAWCQTVPESECDSDYRSVPSSCEATSYCKLGCCYNSKDGTCSKNTPQKVCDDMEGTWEDSPDCDIGQCELGCCLMGDQAAFVTQTRCKSLSSLYGLETNYRTDISSEIKCLQTASSGVEGACVYTQDYEKTCERTTQKECQELEASKGDEASVDFHPDYLCSAEELGTNCGPTQETTCVEGKEEVYFEDSCGNIANIYDASKIEDNTYWKYIAEQTNEIDVCGQGDSNADSATCGNCDYYLGSTCKEYKRSEDRVKPNYGDYICRDLGCEYKGESYEHGETWCAESSGVDDSLPGSRHFRMVCYNGEVSVEPCADFRQEICIESEVNGFRTSGCIANKWEPCTGIQKKEECESSQQDCVWIGDDRTESSGLFGGGSAEIKSASIESVGPKCVPETAPGLNFWKEEENSEETCDQGEITCTITYEQGIMDKIGSDDWSCKEDSLTGGDCKCESSEWQQKMIERCSLLGDCEGDCQGDECGDSLSFTDIKNYIGI